MEIEGNGQRRIIHVRCPPPPHPPLSSLCVYCQSITSRFVKGMLTGPVTILNWSFPRKDLPRSEQAFQIALALRQEVADLEKAGCRILQVPIGLINTFIYNQDVT